MSGKRDPITFELFKNAIFSIADEMALTVFRTTYSGVLKDNMDYSTGFADADGKLVAQGLTLPGHLGSVPTAMESIMRHYGDDMAEGDVFIMNDPFDGGMHLPDIFVFKPLYHEGKRLAFACTVCHHTDVGGRVAGSNASDSTEIYAEGLRIAPLKLYEAGKLNKTIMTFIEKNVRLPVKVFGDLRAQLAACHIAEEQFAELVSKYGPDQIAAFMELKGDNPFRIRAFRTAARTLAGIPGDLGEALEDGSLAGTRGIGPGTLQIIGELAATGRSSVLEDLREQVPPGLVEMLSIAGLGVAKIRQIHDLLDIDSLPELEAAARDGRLAKLPRFGAKTSENILRGINPADPDVMAHADYHPNGLRARPRTSESQLIRFGFPAGFPRESGPYSVVE